LAASSTSPCLRAPKFKKIELPKGQSEHHTLSQKAQTMKLSACQSPFLFLLAAPAIFFPCAAASAGRLRKTLERTLYWRPTTPSLGLTCIDNSVRAGGDKADDYTCITEGESICIDYDSKPMGGRWSFGIKEGYVHLWNPKSEIVWSYCRTVTHVCIGEDQGFDPNKFSEERPYMFFYDEKSQTRVGELICDGTDGKVSSNFCLCNSC